jgi:hypothetical protein
LSVEFEAEVGVAKRGHALILSSSGTQAIKHRLCLPEPAVAERERVIEDQRQCADYAPVMMVERRPQLAYLDQAVCP